MIDSLGEARLVAHWAAQLVAAAGSTLLPLVPDHSHASLEWLDGAIAGAPIGSRRAGLRLHDLSLFVLDERGTAWLPLAGRTLAEGREWLTEKFGAGPLACPFHDLPAHAVADGAPFPAVEGLADLERWFAAGDRTLRALAAETPGASPVRCWPHHFDIATSIALDGARSIGAGLSPGDSSYAEPYWYVTPWPHPPRDNLPALTAGRWHINRWVGAVLTASELDGPDDPRAAAFVSATCRGLR